MGYLTGACGCRVIEGCAGTDPAGALSWAIGGTLLALALCGLGLWLAVELRERRGVN